MIIPLSYTSTVENASAVPVIVWVCEGSGVALTGPVTAGVAMDVSTVNVTEAGEPTLPDGSVMVTASV
jgi:hypothetical protein